MEDKIKDVLDKIKYIEYGFVTPDGIKHKNAKRNFFLNEYRFMSIDDTIKYNIGTCFELAQITQYYLKEKNIDSKKYMIEYDVFDKIAKHTICIAHGESYYYLCEAGWYFDNIKFDSLESTLISVIKRYPRMYKIEGFDLEKIHIYEYDGVIPGMSFQEFCSQVKKSKEIKINLERIYEND